MRAVLEELGLESAQLSERFERALRNIRFQGGPAQRLFYKESSAHRLWLYRTSRCDEARLRAPEQGTKLRTANIHVKTWLTARDTKTTATIQQVHQSLGTAIAVSTRVLDA